MAIRVLRDHQTYCAETEKVREIGIKRDTLSRRLKRGWSVEDAFFRPIDKKKIGEIMETKLNLYQKLAKIRKRVEVMQKDKSGYSYRYVSDAELLAKITGAMENNNVSLIPFVVPGTFHVEPYTYIKTKKGVEETVNELLVNADMVYKWVNNDNPDEYIEVPWALVGHQSDASQSFGSALTYSYRYFLLKYFGVATPDDDPDAWRSKQKAAEAEEDKLLAEQIINTLDETVRTFLADNKDKAAEVKELMTKYVKDANYKKITEPALAQKLLEDFSNSFLK